MARKNERSELNDQVKEWCEATGIVVKVRDGFVRLVVQETGTTIGSGATVHAAVMAAFAGGTAVGFAGALHAAASLSFLGEELHDAFDDTWPVEGEDGEEGEEEDSEEENVHFQRE